jgi:hypothetical protein
MIQVLSSKDKIIDPDKAKYLLSFNTFPDQRPLGRSYVLYLVRKMEDPDGVYVGGNIVFAIHNERKYLVDGQHTLHAVVEFGEPQRMTIKVLACDTWDELGRMYQQYDGGRVRSVADHCRVEKGTLKLDWSHRVISLVVSAATIVRHGLTPNRNLLKDERVRLLRSFLEEGEFLNVLVGPDQTNSRFLMRRHVAAVIMQTYQKDPDAAAVFWEKVKTGEMINRKHPAYHLREFLITHSTRGNAVSKTASSKEFYCKSCKAWNVFRRGQEMKILRFNNNEVIPTLI